MSSAGRTRSAESQRRELDRIGAFSDGVFAVAITLLVLNIEPPDPSATVENASQSVVESFLEAELPDLLSSIQAYFIAFAVIGLFWYGHHVAWSRYERSSGKLVVANLVLLSLIGLMPFTTALLGQFDAPLAVAAYAFNVGLAAMADSWMDRIAIRGELGPPLSEDEHAAMSVAGWLRPAIFFISIPVAFLVSTTVAQLLWFGLFAVHPLARRVVARSASAA